MEPEVANMYLCCSKVHFALAYNKDFHPNDLGIRLPESEWLKLPDIDRMITFYLLFSTLHVSSILYP
uniref:Uncharacterized protein n=1 Tax=Arundo donax TaxID=35708 RepID=A0A0A9GY30_ARUDO